MVIFQLFIDVGFLFECTVYLMVYQGFFVFFGLAVSNMF